MKRKHGTHEKRTSSERRRARDWREILQSPARVRADSDSASLSTRRGGGRPRQSPRARAEQSRRGVMSSAAASARGHATCPCCQVCLRVPPTPWSFKTRVPFPGKNEVADVSVSLGASPGSRDWPTSPNGPRSSARGFPIAHALTREEPTRPPSPLAAFLSPRRRRPRVPRSETRSSFRGETEIASFVPRAAMDARASPRRARARARGPGERAETRRGGERRKKRVPRRRARLRKVARAPRRAPVATHRAPSLRRGCSR